MTARQAGKQIRLVERLLVAAVREHDWDVTPQELLDHQGSYDELALVRLATMHRVTGCLAASLPGSVRGQEAAAALREARFTSATQRLRAEADLRLVAEVLGTDLPWLVFKGPVLARHYYSRPDLRSYVDLDLLVLPATLGLALARFEDAGFTLLDRNWLMLSEQLSGELHLMSPNGGAIDLHWDLFNDQVARRNFALVTKTFFERSQQVAVGSQHVRTLDDLDTLIHTALHAARSGGDRLVWMKDLEQQVLHRPFDWGELAARCQEHQAQLPVVVMLQRARASLSIHGLTDTALGTIGGARAWRDLGRVIDHWAPVVRAGNEGSATRIYARATRADGAGAAVELSKRLLARARRQATRREQVPTWDPTHPRSILFPSGGLAERNTFLRSVASL